METSLEPFRETIVSRLLPAPLATKGIGIERIGSCVARIPAPPQSPMPRPPPTIASQWPFSFLGFRTALQMACQRCHSSVLVSLKRSKPSNSLRTFVTMACWPSSVS
jgi:hypothetical protein